MKEKVAKYMNNAELNGFVLRSLNLQRMHYTKALIIFEVAQQVGIGNYNLIINAINYLNEQSYIRLRDISSKENISRVTYYNKIDVEACVTSKGIRLLAGDIHSANIII